MESSHEPLHEEPLAQRPVHHHALSDRVQQERLPRDASSPTPLPPLIPAPRSILNRLFEAMRAGHITLGSECIIAIAIIKETQVALVVSLQTESGRTHLMTFPLIIGMLSE